VKNVVRVGEESQRASRALFRRKWRWRIGEPPGWSSSIVPSCSGDGECLVAKEW
jgi:hypothetical protein